MQFIPTLFNKTIILSKKVHRQENQIKSGPLFINWMGTRETLGTSSVLKNEEKRITRCLQTQILLHVSLLQSRDNYNVFHGQNTFINFSVVENLTQLYSWLSQFLFCLFFKPTVSFLLSTLLLLVKSLLQLFHFGLFFLYCFFKLTNMGLLKFNEKRNKSVDLHKKKNYSNRASTI